MQHYNDLSDKKTQRQDHSGSIDERNVRALTHVQIIHLSHEHREFGKL